MQPDIAFAHLAIQLLHEKEQKTMQLLDRALAQNRLLLLQYQQQQELLTQYMQTIRRLEAELQACRLEQQSAFSLIHTN